MYSNEKLINKDKYEDHFKEYSSNNENLNESSVEEGNEDLKSKVKYLILINRFQSSRQRSL